MVARERGGDAAAAAEDGAAVAHVGDVEVAVLHQSRRRACAAAYALHTRVRTEAQISNYNKQCTDQIKFISSINCIVAQYTPSRESNTDFFPNYH